MTTSCWQNADIAELFDDVNLTELYQLCRRRGLAVPPGLLREHYIGWLIGELELPTGHSRIDSWRWGLIGFIEDHWMSIRPQLTCPAKNLKDEKNPNPTPCFGCSDVQVVTCVVQNKRSENLIRLRMK